MTSKTETFFLMFHFRNIRGANHFVEQFGNGAELVDEDDCLVKLLTDDLELKEKAERWHSAIDHGVRFGTKAGA